MNLGEFQKLYSERADLRRAYALVNLNECFMCHKEMPVGDKNGMAIIAEDGFPGFNAGFLFHLKSTHGIDPGSFEFMLKANNEDIEKVVMPFVQDSKGKLVPNRIKL